MPEGRAGGRGVELEEVADGSGRPVGGPWPTATAAMRAVLASARVLASAGDESEVLAVAANTACQVLGYLTCAIALRTDDGAYTYRQLSGAAPAETSRALMTRSVPARAVQALMGAGTRIGGIRWIPPEDPVRSRPEVAAATVPTDVSVEGRSWRPGSLLFVPMVDGTGELVGFMTPDDPTSGEVPTLGQALLLESVAELTEIGLETVRARAAAERALAVAEAQRGQLEALLAASLQVRGHQALSEVLGEIAAAMTGAAGFGRAAVYLLDPDGTTLRVEAIVGLPPEEEARLRAAPVPLAEFAAMMQPAMRVGRCYLFDHRRWEVPPELDAKLSVPDADPGWVDGEWHAEDSLTVPLDGPGGELLGVISVDEPVGRRMPGLAEMRALEHFADQCSSAVVQVRRYEAAVAEAGTDPLTGLPNRRVLDSRAGELFSEAERTGRPCAVVVADIDHFKAVNDRWGHQAGDTTIAAVGRVLRERLRAGDLVARWGGEEFVAVLPATDAEEAVAVIEQLRARVAALALPEIGGTTVRMSAGVATAAPGEAPAAAIARADAALYRAKRGGRDRVEVAVPIS